MLRRSFFPLAGLLSAALLALPSATAQNVRVTWIGQACFYVQTEGGPTVVVDPPALSVGYPLPTTAADVVTISHDHTDHNNSAGVRGSFTLLDGRGLTDRADRTAATLPFVLIPGFHDNTNGAARGRNTIVQWTQGGLRFAHFGDFGQDALTDAQLSALQNLDVLMMPAGGFFTVDNQQAARLIDQLKPRVAILMHYRTAIGGPAQLATHPAVTAPFPSIRYKPAAVTLSRAALPASTEVWTMEPVADAVTVSPAGFTAGAPTAPGSLASVFGVFTNSATASASTAPLPRRLGETEVFVGSDPVPLLYVSPGQINYQIPATFAPGQNAVEVRVAGQRVARGSVTTVARAPSLFGAVDASGRIGRARRGEYLSIYGTGQGNVTPAVAEAVAAPLAPLAVTPSLPTVLIGGRPATVSFSGLAPGAVGLWQFNVQVPADAPVGNDVDVSVAYEPNLASNTIKVSIE